jgi:uncharacterized membrane protein YedE/YeeE
MRTFAAFLFGLLFGAGLQVAGMTDPARILSFLDLAGAWNPALALVMGGAILVTIPAFALARRKPVALLGDPIEQSERFRIDGRLVGGAAIFGLGWGLSGICPAPGIVLVGFGLAKAGVFVAAIIAGAWLPSALAHFKAPRPDGSGVEAVP